MILHTKMITTITVDKAYKESKDNLEEVPDLSPSHKEGLMRIGWFPF